MGGEVGKALREVRNCAVGVRKAAVEPVMPSVNIGKRAVEECGAGQLYYAIRKEIATIIDTCIWNIEGIRRILAGIYQVFPIMRRVDKIDGNTIDLFVPANNEIGYLNGQLRRPDFVCFSSDTEVTKPVEYAILIRR